MSLHKLVVQHGYWFCALPPASMLLIGITQQKNVIDVFPLHCKGLLCTQGGKVCDSSFCTTQQENTAFRT